MPRDALRIANASGFYRDRLSALLYEIGGPGDLDPDATARFDTIRLDRDGRDRLRGCGGRGEPPPGIPPGWAAPSAIRPR